MEQSIPIILTQQELAALVQQQQLQLQDIHGQPAVEPELEPQHSSIPTGRQNLSLNRLGWSD